MTTALARLGAAAAVAVAALVPTSASASPACMEYVDLYALNVPGYATCMKDGWVPLINRVGTCTSGYQPMSPPFGQQVLPETLDYVDCLY